MHNKDINFTREKFIRFSFLLLNKHLIYYNINFAQEQAFGYLLSLNDH